MLVAIGIISVIAAFLVPLVGKARATQRSVTCLFNLNQIMVGFRAYADDSEGTLPDPPSAQSSWEILLKPYLASGEAFRCPSDDELYPAVSSSYDWRDTGDPLTTAAGRRIASTRGSAVLVFDALPGWHQKFGMNAGMLDGSAYEMDRDICLRDLSCPAAW